MKSIAYKNVNKCRAAFFGIAEANAKISGLMLGWRKNIIRCIFIISSCPRPPLYNSGSLNSSQITNMIWPPIYGLPGLGECDGHI